MEGCSNTSAETFNHYNPSPAQHHKRYHAFLSFRGTKMRDTLADRLFNSLSTAGVNVFVDSEILNQGKNTGVSREEAIRDSTVHIPIFSPDYARSPSCLDDLLHSWMYKHTGAIIIPLFYNVKPSDVMYPEKESPYAEAFQLLRKIGRRSEQQMNLWMKALREISVLPGWSLEESAGGDEGRLVELVVTDLLDTLPSLDAAKHPEELPDPTSSGPRRRRLGVKSKDSDQIITFATGQILLGDSHQTITFATDHLSIPSVPMGASVDSSAQSSQDCVRYITNKGSEFTWTVIAVTLGNYGLVLSTPVFWHCWSILVAEAVILYLIRPYWMWKVWKWIKSAMPAQTADAWEDYGRAGTVFLKVGMSVALIAMLICLEDLSKRQNKTLFFVGFSIILLEGFREILGKEEFKSLTRNSSEKGMHMIQSRTPSVINAMIVTTGGIVAGGNLGSLMRLKPYWTFVSILVVDLIAEAVHQFDYGNRSDSTRERKPNRADYIVIVLRLIVGGSLCYCMTKEISQKSYFPSQVHDCDLKCKERSKSLLITMVVLGILQAAATLSTACFIIYELLWPSTSATQGTRLTV